MKTNTHLSTLYSHCGMLWVLESGCLMGSLFFFFWVGVLVSETVNNGQTVEQRLDSAQRISSSALDHLILYDTLHHEERRHALKKIQGKRHSMLSCQSRAFVSYFPKINWVWPLAAVVGREHVHDFKEVADRQTDSPSLHAHSYFLWTNRHHQIDFLTRTWVLFHYFLSSNAFTS